MNSVPTALATLVAVASLACSADVETPAGGGATQAASLAPRPAHSTPPQPPAPAEAEAEEGLRFSSLVPEDSFAWVQIGSLDELEQVADEILAGAGGGSGAMSFADLMGFFPVPGVIDNLDPSRPMGFAIGFVEGTMTPASTAVLPALDRGALIQALNELPDAPQAFGIDDYVVATTLPTYEPGRGAAALTDGLPAGALVARVDVPALLESTGEMIDLALWQIRKQAEMPPEAGGPASAFEAEMGLAVLGALEAALDSAESLDLALGMRGDELGMTFALVAEEGSELDGFFPPAGGDLRELARLVDADDPIAMLMNVAPETVRELTPLWTAAVESAAAEDPQYELATAWMRDFADLWPLMGESVVATGSAAAGDLHLCYWFRPADVGAFRDAFAKALAALDELAPGMSVEGPIEHEGELRFVLAVAEPAEGVNLAEIEQRQRELEKLFGTTALPVRFAERDGTAVLTVGSAEDLLERSLARVGREDADVPAHLADVLARVEGASPAFVAQIDFVALVRDFLALMGDEVSTEVAVELADDEPPLPVTYWGGVDGPRWELGFRADFRRFGRLVNGSR